MTGRTNCGAGGGGGKAYAAIAVTYPEGSICTATNGSKTLKAKDTTGTWLFMLPEGGTWTVSAQDDDGHFASKTVDVTKNTVHQLTVLYGVYLYNSGDECTDLTGGWIVSPNEPGNNGKLTKNETSMHLYHNAQNQAIAILPDTLNPTEFGKYSRLYIEVSGWKSFGQGVAFIGIYTSRLRGSLTPIARLDISDNGIHYVDISAISSGYINIPCFQAEFDILKIWFEE